MTTFADGMPGLAAWRGNTRGGSEEAYETVRAVHAGHRRNALSDFQAAGWRSLVLQTHARSLEGARAGFEFIHKSFGEYLAARGLLSFGLRAAGRLTRRSDPVPEETVALDWTRIVSDAELTVEVLRFLRDEARRKQRTTDLTAAKAALESLLSWTNRHGMPVQKSGDLDFRKLETRQRCAESALLSVATSITSALQDGLDDKNGRPPARLRIDWRGNLPDCDAAQIERHIGIAGQTCLELSGLVKTRPRVGGPQGGEP